MGCVAGGVNHVDRPVAEVDFVAAFDPLDSVFGHRFRVIVILPLFTDGGFRPLDESRGVDQVAHADVVNQHRRLGVDIGQIARTTRVVEVDVRRQDVLQRVDSDFVEGVDDDVDVRPQSGVDDGGAVGVENVDRPVTGHVVRAHVDVVDVGTLDCGEVASSHGHTPTAAVKNVLSVASVPTRFCRAHEKVGQMLSRQYLRENPDEVRQNLADRGMADDVDLDRLLDIDEEWRSLKSEGDDLRHERNQVSDRIGQLKADGKDEEAEEAIERSQELKERLEEVETRADELEAELEAGLMEIPNVPHEDVPVGEDESDNVEDRRHGFDDLRDLPETVTPHYDLGEDLDIIDEERGAKTTGAGFYFLKGEGARLEHALIQFMMDVHREQGYVDLFPPVPVKSSSMEGTGQLPKFANDAYRIGGEETTEYDDDDLWLCPTAEVPVTNMYADDILLSDDLPLKHQAYTPNFRREAGEHGTETRGIVRVHQFNKVELVNFVDPEESYDRLEGLVDEAEEVLRRLGLPYRILSLCTGDLTFASAKTYDIEVWAPGTDGDDAPEQGGRWLEVSSASNFEDFQSRRAGLRYRPERHESAEYLHTLNASGTAVGRVMVAILEYYQNEDGTVTVPEALRPYMGGLEVIEGHEKVGESALGSGDRD